MLFPGRTRDQIRNKFKKEEKENGQRIDMALRERLPIGKSNDDLNVSAIFKEMVEDKGLTLCAAGEDEHRMLAEKAKKIAEEEKRRREAKERGESEPPQPTHNEVVPQPRRPVIAPSAGPPPEKREDGEAVGLAAEAMPAGARRGSNGEIILDRSVYEANRYGTVILLVTVPDLQDPQLVA